MSSPQTRLGHGEARRLSSRLYNKETVHSTCTPSRGLAPSCSASCAFLPTHAGAPRATPAHGISHAPTYPPAAVVAATEMALTASLLSMAAPQTLVVLAVIVVMVVEVVFVLVVALVVVLLLLLLLQLL